jgi:hypothetical protein
MVIDKKSIWKYIIGFVIIAGIGYGIYKLNTQPEKYFNKIELNNTNKILNQTEMKYIDTILLVGLEEINYKGIVIIVRPITITNDNPDFELYAHIVPDKNNNNVYLIEIDERSKLSIVETISHEMIHLIQLRSGHLKWELDYVIWKSDTIYNIPEYANREWEQDAVGLGRILEKRLKERLYE